ncbi:MAG: hypothetical protein J4F50_06970 [Acidimicrobiia bacterium]|nr:hypothetical protein [Acidimicrobiia bacterium]
MLIAVGGVLIQRPDPWSMFGDTLDVPAEAGVLLGKLRASGVLANALRDLTAHADGRS